MLRWFPGVSTQFRLASLVAASYLFYGWWDWRFTGLLAISTLIDYEIGNRIASTEERSRRVKWLIASLVTNLSILAYFKYMGFLASSINAVLDWARVGGALPIPDILLPVGISFYTFQTLSYSIDIFRGEAKPAVSRLHFAAYVSLFPQLVAGPIVRYSEFDDQLRNIKPKADWPQIATGIYFFTAGMAQKILLADTIATKIQEPLADYQSLGLIGSWYCMLGYTCQLYFDFAGYSNMAVGLGHLLGFQFQKNFDSPYQASSISDFWRRCHITLSSWLRDYIFIPLGGSREGTWLTVRNLMVVMFLGGLWHGAGWTFVLWGVYHGILLATGGVLHRLTNWRAPHQLAIPTTFILVLVGWVLFRSTDLNMASSLLMSMFGQRGIEPEIVTACGGVVPLVILSALLGIVWFAPSIWSFKPRWNLATALALSLLMVACILRISIPSPFLYFQF
jgi:alginate O-acetyltransferase complex protein AlgI